jgi:polyphosphate glucokinase
VSAPRVLVVDVGGTHVKLMCPGMREPVKLDSGPAMTAGRMVAAVKRAAAGCPYDRVSIGYPGPVAHGRPAKEPHNLGGGWLRYDFAAAFERPVRIINDASMQALGSYEGGRMLFLGLGTGLGSALVLDDVLVSMELAHLPYRHGRTYEEYVGAAGLVRLGKRRWRHHVARVVELLRDAMEADYVVLGGGNARKLGELPAGARLGDNENAFRGGLRLWEREPRGVSTSERVVRRARAARRARPPR